MLQLYSTGSECSEKSCVRKSCENSYVCVDFLPGSCISVRANGHCPCLSYVAGMCVPTLVLAVRMLSLHALLSLSSWLICLVEQHTLSSPWQLTVIEMDRYFYIRINKFNYQIWHLVPQKLSKKMKVYEMIWLKIYASFIMDRGKCAFGTLFILENWNKYNKWSLLDFTSGHYPECEIRTQSHLHSIYSKMTLM